MQQQKRFFLFRDEFYPKLGLTFPRFPIRIYY
jgi:hypothetical protein